MLRLSTTRASRRWSRYLLRSAPPTGWFLATHRNIPYPSAAHPLIPTPHMLFSPPPGFFAWSSRRRCWSQYMYMPVAPVVVTGKICVWFRGLKPSTGFLLCEPVVFFPLWNSPFPHCLACSTVPAITAGVPPSVSGFEVYGTGSCIHMQLVLKP
jgi:hypothetical protein